MQVHTVGVPLEEENPKDANRYDILSESFETNTVVTTENDVIILEESTVVGPAPVLITSSYEATSEY